MIRDEDLTAHIQNRVEAPTNSPPQPYNDALPTEDDEIEVLTALYGPMDDDGNFTGEEVDDGDS